MDTLMLSPNCPLAINQGTHEVEGSILRFIEAVVAYHTVDESLLPNAKLQMEAYGTTEFAQEHGSEKLTAARGCARAITDDSCPFWRYDTKSNSLITKIDQYEEQSG